VAAKASGAITGSIRKTNLCRACRHCSKNTGDGIYTRPCSLPGQPTSHCRADSPAGGDIELPVPLAENEVWSLRRNGRCRRRRRGLSRERSVLRCGLTEVFETPSLRRPKSVALLGWGLLERFGLAELRKRLTRVMFPEPKPASMIGLR